MPTHTSRPKTRAIVAGVTAVFTGLAAGQLVASFVAPEAAPAVAVGSRLIDLTPTPVKEWAVATLGTWDKPVLIGGVVIVTLAMGALIGLLSLRRPAWRWAGPASLTVIAAAAAAAAPAAGMFAVVPALATGVVGGAVLHWLLRGTPQRVDDDRAPHALPRRAFITGTAVASVSGAVALIAGSTEPPPSSRHAPSRCRGRQTHWRRCRPGRTCRGWPHGSRPTRTSTGSTPA